MGNLLLHFLCCCYCLNRGNYLISAFSLSMFYNTYYLSSSVCTNKLHFKSNLAEKKWKWEKNLKTNLRIFKLKKYSHVKQANYMKNRNFTKLATPPWTPTKNLSLQTRHTCTTLRKTGDCSAAIYAWDKEAIWLLPSQLQLLETTDQFKQFLVLTTIILVGVFSRFVLNIALLTVFCCCPKIPGFFECSEVANL